MWNELLKNFKIFDAAWEKHPLYILFLKNLVVLEKSLLFSCKSPLNTPHPQFPVAIGRFSEPFTFTENPE